MKSSRPPKRHRRQAIRKIRRNPNENEPVELYVVARTHEYEGLMYLSVYDNYVDAAQDFLFGAEDIGFSFSFTSTYFLGPVKSGENLVRKVYEEGIDDIDRWAAGDRNRMSLLRSLRSRRPFGYVD